MLLRDCKPGGIVTIVPPDSAQTKFKVGNHLATQTELLPVAKYSLNKPQFVPILPDDALTLRLQSTREVYHAGNQ